MKRYIMKNGKCELIRKGVILTEWFGNGSGEPTTYKNMKEAMLYRECTLTERQALKKTPGMFYGGGSGGVKCSEIGKRTWY